MGDAKPVVSTTASAATAAAEMKIDPVRAAALVEQLQAVRARVSAASSSASVSTALSVRLVAVSKLKPANDILALHRPASAAIAPQTHFGENYAQELRDKAALLPRSIQWHFIGGLQSGHCKPLARVPNLWCVSSVDSLKKARLLEGGRAALADAEAAAGSSSSLPPLRIHVQVNTSGEDNKSGCPPGADTIALCRAIVETCPHLRLLGLMTIGAIARSHAVAAAAPGSEAPENPDFVALRQQRDLVQDALRDLLPADQPPLELSMGMSEDFESAIASGSSEVRIGSTIFGLRGPKSEAKLIV